MYDRLIFSAAASSVKLAYSPLSSIRCQGCARASALTSALSTRGRGRWVSPSGVITSFRPRACGAKCWGGRGRAVTPLDGARAG